MNLFSLSYWISHPYGEFGALPLYIGVSVLLLVFSMVSKIYLKKNKENKVLTKYLKPLPEGLFWLSLVGFLFTFFRYENVYIFSSRLWVLIIVIAFLLWSIPKIVNFAKNYKTDLEKFTTGKGRNKYKPKRKKK